MTSALFFRKCTNKKMLEWNYDNVPDFGQLLNYKIVETKKLNLAEYKNFINNFLNDYDFIDIIKDRLFMDENDCVHCLLVNSDSDSGILVYPSGYSYARYVALYKK